MGTLSPVGRGIRGEDAVRGSGVWHAERAWLGHVATDVLIEVEDGRIFAVAENVQPPADAVKLEGFTFPGLANVHSHVFQESLRGRTETGGGDFWEWRRPMFDAPQGWDGPSYTGYARAVFPGMLHAGITAGGGIPPPPPDRPRLGAGPSAAGRGGGVP